jgi:hypothetical protein
MQLEELKWLEVVVWDGARGSFIFWINNEICNIEKSFCELYSKGFCFNEFKSGELNEKNTTATWNLDAY